MSHHNVENPPSFYLSIPSADIDAITKFYSALGFTSIPAYSDPNTAAFRLPAPNANICLMSHSLTRFKEFMRPGTAVVDANAATEALFSIAVAAKDEVDATVKKAVDAGGKADPYTLPNYGMDCGMYTRSFADLDGHIWEAVAMIGECGGNKEESK